MSGVWPDNSYLLYEKDLCGPLYACQTNGHRLPGHGALRGNEARKLQCFLIVLASGQRRSKGYVLVSNIELLDRSDMCRGTDGWHTRVS